MILSSFHLPDTSVLVLAAGISGAADPVSRLRVPPDDEPEVGVETSDDESSSDLPLINLRVIFPQSPRLILLRCAWAMLAFFLCAVALIQTWRPTFAKLDETFLLALTGFLFLLMCGIALKILHEMLSFLAFRYLLEDDRLVFIDGVLIRSREELPLASAGDVEIRRLPLENLFRLYTVCLLDYDGKAVELISGLPRRQAVALRSFLLSAIKSTQPLHARQLGVEVEREYEHDNFLTRRKQ